MHLEFRAPGVALRIEELLERARPSRGVTKLLRDGRLRWARTFGIGAPWQPGAPVRDIRAQAPPGAAFWLDDASDAPAPLPEGNVFELELAALAWRSGVVPVQGGSRFAFEVLEHQGDRARVRFVCEGDGAARVRSWAAQAGAPVVGDFVHGGTLAEADEPLFARSGALRISEAARRALSRGHPWLTRDRESEDEGRYAQGTLVELRAEAGDARGLARIEGGPQLVARMWEARNPDEIRTRAAARKPASIEERALRALARREKLLASGETDAVRLVHGEADALPGLFIDRFSSSLRVLVAGRAALPLWERASTVLASALSKELGGETSCVLVLALRPAPPGELECVYLASGPPPAEPLVVREGTLRFRVDLGLGEPGRPRPGVGFFTDQRANRQRLASRVRSSGRYLNLFAHTGAFSAALLAAGAGDVTSVDLSASYLAQLEANLARSGLASERHRSVRRDARRFLAELADDERFDGIVLDPPTAAFAGRSFWSARGGLAELVESCLLHVAPGGFLLITCNDRSARSDQLSRLAASAAERIAAQVRIADAAPSPDSPNLRGFPEGAALKGVLVERKPQHPKNSRLRDM